MRKRQQPAPARPVLPAGIWDAVTAVEDPLVSLEGALLVLDALAATVPPAWENKPALDWLMGEVMRHHGTAHSRYQRLFDLAAGHATAGEGSANV